CGEGLATSPVARYTLITAGDAAARADDRGGTAPSWGVFWRPTPAWPPRWHRRCPYPPDRPHPRDKRGRGGQDAAR
ncbi:MAG: hypothetical protein AVDCRST_MAG54-3136, partial [uncultured Actinomycetospora sp.]